MRTHYLVDQQLPTEEILAQLGCHTDLGGTARCALAAVMANKRDMANIAMCLQRGAVVKKEPADGPDFKAPKLEPAPLAPQAPGVVRCAWT